MMRSPVPALALAPLLLVAQVHRPADDRAPRAQDAPPAEGARTDDLATTLARFDHVEWATWGELSELLADVHARTGVPALAAAWIADGKIVACATVGVERFGSDRAVPPDAPFHLGSVTKPITATVIARLVEEGALDWGTRVAEVMDDLEMHEQYRDVTVEELLRHRGRLHAFTTERPDGMPEVSAEGSPSDQRAAFLAAALRLPPPDAADEAPLYSNAGYALAGAMAERVAGAGWEELVARHAFGPLGMSDAGFGVPASPAGHAGDGPAFLPVPLDAYPRLEHIAPAGNVHAPVTDLARFALAHLDGLAGRDGALRAETFRRLHEADDGGWAIGWRCGVTPSGEPVRWHGGTVGASYAEVRLHPASGTAAVVMTTVGPGLGETLVARIVRAMSERYAPQAGEFVSAGPSLRIETVEGDVPEADDEVFWRVVDGLARAMNDEDRAAYRALFDPDYDAGSRDSLFDFVAEHVIPRRGGIRAFHAPHDPIRIEGSERVTRVVTFHLENGYPGYIGISLGDDGKLVELSFFVKPDLCPHGTDRHCPEVTRELDGEGR